MGGDLRTHPRMNSLLAEAGSLQHATGFYNRAGGELTCTPTYPTQPSGQIGRSGIGLGFIGACFVHRGSP